MKARMLLLSAFGVLLAGCITTPQTKTLITPVGVVGIHSFAPPQQQLRPRKELERRLAQQGRADGEPTLHERS